MELRDSFGEVVGQESEGYWYDLANGEIFRVDDSTANLTDDELGKYSDLVYEADFLELKQFITFDVFTPERRCQLPKGSNVVDCVWIRKWKMKPKIIKSRLCSRGCFDKQKYSIERHSSTATR
eukprot:3099268-Lingulodinium_polyedra.AAC.1